MRRAAILTMTALAAALLAGCSGAQPVQTIQLTAREFTYGTREITLPKDKPVALQLVNQGSVLHDLTVEKMPVSGLSEAGGAGHGGGHGGQEVHTSADPGKTATVQFIPTAAGTYELVCSVAGHKEAGMKATLVVK